MIDEQFVAELHRALGAVLELIGGQRSSKAYRVEEKRLSNARAYKMWTEEEEKNLKADYSHGRGVSELSEKHGRAPTAIISRLYQLGILKSTERPRWD